mgnify:CR=1 FL=1
MEAQERRRAKAGESNERCSLVKVYDLTENESYLAVSGTRPEAK